MAVITPQTDVYLLKVPLEMDEANQLTFANTEAQFNYFNSVFKLEVDNFTYQRKDSTIRFGANFDELVEYNYCMYRNDAYSNKWFYAFITKMEYINDNVTAITIKTDPWQTYQFDITLKSCLVDREHVNDDTVGKNTLPEELELGDFVTNGNVMNYGGTSNYYTVIEVSMVENEGDSQTLSYEWEGGTAHDTTPSMNGIPRGTTPLIVGGTGLGDLDAVRDVYDVAGLGDAIVNVYVLPQALVPSYNLITLSATNPNTSASAYHIGIPAFSTSETSLGQQTFTRPTTVNGYTPVNKKLLTWPFCYFNISNNAGSSVPYRYEDFGTNIVFKNEGTFGASGSVKSIPLDYKGISSSQNALDYSVTGAKYPICSWKSDSYTNWLTQNAVNMQTEWKSTILGGLSSGAGAAYTAIGAGVSPVVAAGGAAVALGVGIIQTAKEQHLAKTSANFIPDQVKGNLGAGDFLWAKYHSPFTYLPMSIKAEYARCIDEYFSQFGYKCNRVKVPNITGRRTWNYVKTVGSYIEGSIPQEDMQELKNMFDRGVTFWHNPVQFGNYGANNDII